MGLMDVAMVGVEGDALDVTIQGGIGRCGQQQRRTSEWYDVVTDIHKVAMLYPLLACSPYGSLKL